MSVLLTVVGPGTVPGTWEDLSICSVNGGRWTDGHIDGWMDGWLEGRGGREERVGKICFEKGFHEEGTHFAGALPLILKMSVLLLWIPRVPATGYLLFVIWKMLEAHSRE